MYASDFQAFLGLRHLFLPYGVWLGLQVCPSSSGRFLRGPTLELCLEATWQPLLRVAPLGLVMAISAPPLLKVAPCIPGLCRLIGHSRVHTGLGRLIPFILVFILPFLYFPSS